MTLKELKIRVYFALQQKENENLDVCIPNNKGGLYGGIPVTKIINAGQGIDWDHQKFILTPENEMIEKLMK